MQRVHAIRPTGAYLWPQLGRNGDDHGTGLQQHRVQVLHEGRSLQFRTHSSMQQYIMLRIHAVRPTGAHLQELKLERHKLSCVL